MEFKLTAPPDADSDEPDEDGFLIAGLDEWDLRRRLTRTSQAQRRRCQERVRERMRLAGARQEEVPLG